jgi:hypothetical protein
MAALLALAFWKKSRSYPRKFLLWRLSKAVVDTGLVVLMVIWLTSPILGSTFLPRQSCIPHRRRSDALRLLADATRAPRARVDLPERAAYAGRNRSSRHLGVR